MTSENDCSFNTITARTLRIVDSRNRPRIVITTPDDAAALALVDVAGNPCLQLLILDDVTKLVLRSPSGTTRVVVASDHQTNEAGVMVYRKNGTLWFAASSGDEGGDMVVTVDETTEPIWFAPNARADSPGQQSMDGDEFNDVLNDRFNEAKGFITRSIDGDPATARNDLQEWKAAMKQLLCSQLGHNAAEKFDAAGNFNLIHPTPRQLIDALKALQTCVAEVVVAARRQ
ncbi:MAG TPA: hypothetical protein VE974_11290 [Thermoanaerobaculia bacterium]|nr:hypothetical protein [Thermoanaerobaculia bacterium]